MMMIFTFLLIRPRLLTKMWQQILKQLLSLTSAQYIICHFPFKMELPGVMIVIMFQHKVHVNRKYIWDHP